MTEANGGGKPPLLPNTFKTFNVYVDQAMQYLTPEEYVVLSYTARHILGWRKKIVERRGHISLSMYEHGFGDDFGGTGLSRPTIIKALATLEKYKFIKRVGNKNNAKGQRWQLTEHPDIDGLRDHAIARKAINKGRTVKARIVREMNKASKSDNTSKRHNTSNVTHDEYSSSATTPVLVQSDLPNKRKGEKERIKESTLDANASSVPATEKPKAKANSKKKPTRSPEEHAAHDALQVAIASAFKYEADRIPSEVKSLIAVTAWKLLDTRYLPGHVPHIFRYCRDKLSTFTVAALSKYAADARNALIETYGRDIVEQPFVIDDAAEGTPPEFSEDEPPPGAVLHNIEDLWDRIAEDIDGARVAGKR